MPRSRMPSITPPGEWETRSASIPHPCLIRDWRSSKPAGSLIFRHQRLRSSFIPESVIHSMVEFVDGSVIAQMSPPDMRTPIQYALTYPERADGNSRRLDLTHAFKLNFEPPDFDRFPALRIAFDVATRGGTLGAVMNAANEAAVDAFVAGKITFGEISRLVELTIADHRLQAEPTLDDLLEADRWALRTGAVAGYCSRTGQDTGLLIGNQLNAPF